MSVALSELFTTDIGLLSLATITFIIGMGSYFAWYVRKNMKLAEAEQGRR